jgi:hypothetical protein
MRIFDRRRSGAKGVPPEVLQVLFEGLPALQSIQSNGVESSSRNCVAIVFKTDYF